MGPGDEVLDEESLDEGLEFDLSSGEDTDLDSDLSSGLTSGHTLDIDGLSDEDATGQFAVGTESVDLDLSEISEEPEEEPEQETIEDLEPEESLEDEDDEDEDEEQLSPKDKFVKKLQEELPFLMKLFSKGKKSSKEEDEDEDLEQEDQTTVSKKKLPKNIFNPEEEAVEDLDELDDLDGEEEKGKLQTLIEEKVPSLAPLVSKFLNKSKGKSSKKSSKTEDDLDDLDDEDGEEEKPKRKIKIIHVAIIGLLALFVLYEDEETTPAPSAPQVKPKYKRKAKKAPKDEAPAVIAEPKVVEDKVPGEEPVEEPAIDDSVQEVQKVEDELDGLFDEGNIAANDNGSENDLENDLENGAGEVPDFEPAPEPEPVPEPVFEPEIPSAQDKSEQGVSDLEIDDSVINEVTESSGGEEITDAILKQLEMNAKARRDETIAKQNIEPTSPPNYLDFGAGLVYNCSGRHWACVSNEAFEQCGKNYAWNVKEVNPVECYPSELYESNLDCESMQQYKTDMAAKTKFCQ